MTKLSLLHVWAYQHGTLVTAWGAFHDATGADGDGQLGKAVWALWSAYTDSIAKLVGDTDQWLEWYCYDNEMGKRGLHAAPPHSDLRPIKDLDDLLLLIAPEPAA